MSNVDVVEISPGDPHADPPRSRRSARRFRWARDAARSRRGQQAVVAAVVALLVAFASLLVLLTTSIARTMVDQSVSDLGPLGRTIELSANGEGTTIPPSRLAPALGSQWDGLAGPIVSEFRTTVTPRLEGNNEVTLLSRKGACQHLRFTSGRCPSGRSQLALSTASAKVVGLGVGDRVQVADPGTYTAEPTVRTLRVAGIFRQPADDPFWRGLDITTAPVVHQGLGVFYRHKWVVPAEAFGGTRVPQQTRDTTLPPPTKDSPLNRSWTRVQTSVSRQLIPGALGYDQLGDAVSAVERTRTTAARLGVDAQVTEQVTAVDERVGDDLDQIQVIAPLLLAQLVLLQLILVWIVLRALLTGRRSEVAVLRLRTPGRRGARRLLLGELVPPVVVGLPAGLALAYVLDQGFRAFWLGGTGGSWSWLALGVAALTTLACVALLVLLVRGLVRTPVSDLLRNVPTRQHRWALSPPQAVVLTLAVAMLVTVATGTLTGAPVLVTPLVIAIAAGLLVGGLLVPVGNRVAGRLLRRERLSTLLALTDLARRPSTRNLILAMTAAGALLAFTTSTLALGMNNREDAASVEVGSPVRLAAVDVNGVATPSRGVRAVDRVDPSHRHLTPVVRVRSGGSDGPVLLAGYPSAMSRIALRAGHADPWRKLTSARAGNGVPAVVATWSPPSDQRVFDAPTLTSTDGTYARVAGVDLIAGGDEHTFIAPLKPLLSQADRSDNFSVEVWSDGTDPAALRRAEAALRKAGFDDFDRSSAADTRRELDRSASAYGLQLGLIVAVGAVVVAALVLLAVRSSQRRGRRRSHRALTRAGVRPAALSGARRIEIVLTVLPLLVGGVVGWVGARLAAPHVPWFTTPPAYPISSVVPPVPPSLAALLAGLVVVGIVALIIDRRSAR